MGNANWVYLGEDKNDLKVIMKLLKPIPKEFDLKIESDKYLQQQLTDGIQVELEHTDSVVIATIIAKHHLIENPNYYIYLISMEKMMDKEFNQAIQILSKVLTKKEQEQIIIALKIDQFGLQDS
jgi:hypothetical protein